ncbi:MAG: hypothetical protein IKD85_03950 [Firmicutes bacterium]|nr:hypothetical protein [Bacillota bacterium]
MEMIWPYGPGVNMEYNNNSYDEREKERVINEFLANDGSRSSGKRKGGRRGTLSRIRNTPFRDNLYNYSDVLTVILIIVLAAIFIFWRVNVLLNYHSNQPAELSSQETSVEQVDSGQKLEQAMEDDAEEVASETEGTQSFEIAQNMTLPEVVDSLYNAGLITDKEAFTEAVEQAGAEGQLHVGVFDIPAGASDTEIIAILTN